MKIQRRATWQRHIFCGTSQRLASGKNVSQKRLAPRAIHKTVREYSSNRAVVTTQQRVWQHKLCVESHERLASMPHNESPHLQQPHFPWWRQLKSYISNLFIRFRHHYSIQQMPIGGVTNWNLFGRQVSEILHIAVLVTAFFVEQSLTYFSNFFLLSKLGKFVKNLSF